MHNFKELKIWKKSIKLTENIYSLLVEYPDFEKYGLTNQMRRSAVSIPSNIAEGSGRESNKDFKRFLAISLSSSYELETQLILSFELGFISEKDFNNVSGELKEIQKMIYGFRKTLNNSKIIEKTIISNSY